MGRHIYTFIIYTLYILHINYIDTNICHGNIIEKTFWQRGDSYLRR